MKKIPIWALVAAAGMFALNNGAYAQDAGAPDDKKGCADIEDCSVQAEDHWKEIKQRFEARKRTRDPFGAKMDPGTFSATVVIPEKQADAPVAVEKKVISLQDAVEKFQVNMVYPKRQMVMVGFDAYKKGEMVKIQHDGVLFKLRIVKVTKEEVVFINTENQETATKRLGVVRKPGTSSSSGSGSSGLKSIFDNKSKVIK